MESAEFTVLYRQHYPRVLAYALRRARPDMAREAADETFTVAWRRRSDIPVSVLPWLLVVTRNLLSEQLRREIRYDVLQAEIAACAGRDELGADVEVIERLTVLRALAALSDRDREALMLVGWDGLTPRDAALVSGSSTATFAVRLHRARRRLAAAMATTTGGDDAHASDRHHGPVPGRKT